MDDYAGDAAGQLLAGRYRLLLSPAEAEGVLQWRAYDEAAGQEVLVRQVPLPEVVDAELVGEEPEEGGGPAAARRTGGRATRRPADPGVRRALDAAVAASRLPDHPRLDQVFDVFVEGDGLWIVSELLPARPLASILAERPLNPHRAAEIGADLLAALRAVHAQGWTHRNVTARTVLVCDDGRAVLTGLAAGAAEEALCGYGGGSADVPPPRAGDGFGGPARPADSGVAGGRTADAIPPGDPAPDAERGDEPDPAGASRRQPSGEDGSPDEGREGVSRSQTGPGAVGGRPAGAGGLPGEGRADVSGRPVGGAPWGTAAEGGSEHAHTYAGADPRTPAHGGNEHGPARPVDAVAAHQEGTRAARGTEESPHLPPGGRAGAADDGWWPFDEDEPGEQTPGGEADGTGSGSGPADDRWWPFDEVDEPRPQPPAVTPPLPDGWEPAGAGETTRPSALGAERARDARMAVVGAVTERWAPEQAGGPHAGPAADLWALGALLFRAVQGRAPYPEDAAAELVRLVRAHPPASAEGCGPLRPVVESLLRREPAERSDADELRGRLNGIVRSAPEPEVGRHTLVGPPSLAPGGPADPRRLPVRRRRGELVRQRRAAKAKPPKAPKPPEPRKAPTARRTAPPAPVAVRPSTSSSPPPPARTSRPRRARSPRSLGRLLLGLVLLLLTGAVLYAMWFLPGHDGPGGDGGTRKERSSVGAPVPADTPRHEPSEEPEPRDTPEPEASPTQDVPSGFALYDAPSGFRIAVPEGWHHSGVNDRGQVRFDKGDFEMIVVKGRDSTKKYGTDPMDYQSEDEPELKPYRASDWATASGLRRIDVGGHAMAEGAYTWKDASGREVYVRNRALILDGRYHLVLVVGPSDARDEVDRYFEGAADTYRVLRR